MGSLKNSLWFALSQRKHLVLLVLSVLAVLLAASLWVMSIAGFIPGSWSPILSALFTVLSAISALLQLYMGRALDQQSISRASLAGTSLGTSKRKGALLVYVKKKYLGSTIRLCRGFADIHGATMRAANVVERWVDNSPVFVAIFPAVEPDNYTVHLDREEHGALVTISAAQTAEVDWRYRDVDKEAQRRG